MFVSNIIYNCNCVGRHKSYEYHICDRTYRTPVSLQEISTVYLLFYLNSVSHNHSLHTMGGATFDVLWGLVSLPLPENLKKSIIGDMNFNVKSKEEFTFVRQEVRWACQTRTINSPVLIFQSHTTLPLEDMADHVSGSKRYKNVIFLDIEGIGYKGKELFTNYIKTNCNTFRISEINTRWPDYIETTNDVPCIKKNDLIPIYNFLTNHFMEYATLAFKSDIQSNKVLLPANTCTSLVAYYASQ